MPPRLMIEHTPYFNSAGNGAKTLTRWNGARTGVTGVATRGRVPQAKEGYGELDTEEEAIVGGEAAV